MSGTPAAGPAAEEAESRGVKRVRVESFPGAYASKGGRRTFWVEAPRRRVVDRLAFFGTQHRPEQSHGGPRKDVTSQPRPAQAPHRLTVIVARHAGVPDRTAFLQPIAETSWKRADRCDTSESSPPPEPPFFFAVPLYVWQDSTLREILEVVLAQSEAAAAVLLGDTAQQQHPHHHYSRHPRRLPRAGAAADATREAEDEAKAPASQAPHAVDVLHVSVGSDRRPRVNSRPLATLSLTRSPPPRSEVDRITMDELRTSRKERFHLGDLLVLVPSKK